MDNFSITAKTVSAFQASNPWDSAEDSDQGRPGSVRNLTQSTSFTAGSTSSPPSYNNIIASTSQESLPTFPSVDNLSAFAATASISNTQDDPWSTAAQPFNNNPSNISSTTYDALGDISDHQPHKQNSIPSGEPLNRSQFPRLKEYRFRDKIKIEISSESKSIFEPVIYIITSAHVHKEGPVLRRYSDFLWLQEILLKRYPFRTVTSLPPKKAIGAGHAFLERRRRGLVRFLNCIANHPVLSLDDVYITFMTCTSSIQEFKYSAQIHYDEEFFTAQITPEVVESIPVAFDDHLSAFKVKAHMESIWNLLTVFEKIMHKLIETGGNFVQVSSLLTDISRKNYCMLADCDKCFEFEANSDEVVEGMVNIGKSYQDQVVAMSGDMIECLKTYRDVLAGYQLLLSRKNRALPELSNVPIVRRIASSKNKLVELTAKGANQRELDQVTSSIDQDEREIEYNTAKVKFIRYCLWNEFDFIHSYKELLVQFIQDCSKIHIQFSSEALQAWTLVLSTFKPLSTSL